MILSQTRLHDVLRYDPDTGHFTWRVKRNNRHKIGSIAGWPTRGGYIQIGIDGEKYLAHRLVWLYVHGAWPSGSLDHINGDPGDNKLVNLRECAHCENLQNTKTRTDSRRGLTGACFHKHSGRYAAIITAYGKRHHLGYFDTAEAAHATYLAAKQRLHLFQPTPRLTGLDRRRG